MYTYVGIFSWEIIEEKIMTEDISFSADQRTKYPEIFFSVAEKIWAERINIPDGF